MDVNTFVSYQFNQFCTYLSKVPLIACGQILEDGVHVLSLVGVDCNREVERFSSQQDLTAKVVMGAMLRLDLALNAIVQVQTIKSTSQAYGYFI